MRAAMVDGQLRVVGVNDPAVVAAMREVPREVFVPASLAALAYLDEDLPLGDGRVLRKPVVLGRLLTALAVEPGETVAVVGDDTGYASAVVASIGGVPTVAVGPGRADAMRGALAAARVQGVMLEDTLPPGPFDAMLFCGAVTDVPQAMRATLRDGARVAAPVIGADGVCRLSLGRHVAGRIAFVDFADVTTDPLPGFTRAPAFTF